MPKALLITKEQVVQIVGSEGKLRRLIKQGEVWPGLEQLEIWLFNSAKLTFDSRGNYYLVGAYEDGRDVDRVLERIACGDSGLLSNPVLYGRGAR